MSGCALRLNPDMQKFHEYLQLARRTNPQLAEILAKAYAGVEHLFDQQVIEQHDLQPNRHTHYDNVP